MNQDSHGKTIMTYHGHAMFEIESSKGVKTVTDPYNERIKNVLPDIGADIVLVSHGHLDHNNVSIVKGNPQVVSSINPVIIKDISIEGIPSFHDTKNGELRGNNIIFRFIVDGIVFLHMGDLGHSLSSDDIEKIKDTDILMIPVGGIYTLNFNEAAVLAKNIGPKVVIPMHYKETDSKLDVDRVDPFLSKWQSYEKKGHSILISKDDLDFSGTLVWVFDSK